MKRHVALTRDEKAKLTHSGNGQDRKRQIIVELCVRQSWICFWCGQQMTNENPADPTYRTLEHVIAKATGGKRVSTLSNMRAACRRCNNLRAQWNIGVLEKEANRLRGLVGSLEEKLHRQKVAMSGRCYFCKARYWFKRWLNGWTKEDFEPA